jgi:hypothetical protein
VDLHESDELDGDDVQVEAMSPSAADPGLNALGDRLEHDVIAQLGSAGLTAAAWPFPVTDGVTVQDAAALSHSLNLLVETPSQDRELEDRHRIQLAALTAAAEFQRTEDDVIARTVADSREWAHTGAARGAEYVFRDGARIDGTTAYALTDAQHAEVADRLDVLGIDARRDGGGWTVERDQDAALLIPMFLDPASPDHGVAARPISAAR